jgi:hypothetical protein
MINNFINLFNFSFLYIQDNLDVQINYNNFCKEHETVLLPLDYLIKEFQEYFNV